MNTETAGRRNQYFVPGDGISREVITADICKYLDNDATVRPGDYQGRSGYYIYAYRNLTTAMIDDLKSDSVRWEQEKTDRARQRGARPGGGAANIGRPRPAAPIQSPETPSGHNADQYVNSRTHESRQLYGPSTVRDTPSPGAQTNPPGRQPPVTQEFRTPAPGSFATDPHFQQQQHGPGNYPPQSRPGYTSTYPPDADSNYGSYVPPNQGQDLRGAPPSGYDYHQRFPSDPTYEYQSHARQPHPANGGRAYPPQPAGGPPPQSSDSFYSDTRPGQRQDTRADNRSFPDDRYYSDRRRP